MPAEIIVMLVENAIRDRGWEGGKFLVDGFPRSFDNLLVWDRTMCGKVNVRFCLYFDCSEAVIEARLLERGETSGRADDNVESIKKRFRTFFTETMPVVKKLEREGRLRRVNSERSVEEVWADVRALFKSGGSQQLQATERPRYQLTLPHQKPRFQQLRNPTAGNETNVSWLSTYQQHYAEPPSRHPAWKSEGGAGNLVPTARSQGAVPPWGPLEATGLNPGRTQMLDQLKMCSTGQLQRVLQLAVSNVLSPRASPGRGV